MGMYDEFRAINIAHKKFAPEHNGHVFQTKDMDCKLAVYCVFNNMLYEEVSDSDSQDIANMLDFSGTLNIYSDITKGNITRWVEYDLVFHSGMLANVIPYEGHIIRDNRDLSSLKLHKPSNRVEITISVSGCDNLKKDDFVNNLDDKKIDAIREILGEPTATIYYPIKVPKDSQRALFSLQGEGIISIASVVQTSESFTGKEGVVSTTAPNGDKITIILDESGYYR